MVIATSALRLCVALVLADCGALPLAGGAPATSQRSAGPSTTGNISWSKHRLDLKPPPAAGRRAILSYWGPDGYFAEPPYCKNGGQFSAVPHRKYGNPRKYMHVVYWFKAVTSGRDDCAFTVVLANTGSPPFAIIRLHLTGSEELR
ncbi:MAG: hypothetical protein WB609_12725 [Candidatus Cybelea sp.]